MPLTQQRKDGLTLMEYGAFMRQTGVTKVFLQQVETYKGSSYTIYKSSTDPDRNAKADGVNLAVQTIVDNGFTLPPGLRVYCTEAVEAQNRAFHRDPSWNQVCYIILGPNAAKGGSVQSVSKNPPPGFTHAACTCIHEIGHNLHERSAGDDRFFGTGGPLTGAAATASKVTGYAMGNKKEFIAEVFAGINCGLKYPADVIREYTALWGPAGGGLPGSATV
jgi:hypothetical protein